jgi:hypothetical protein
MGRQWLGQGGCLVHTNGAGNGLSFGSASWLVAAPLANQADWRNRRTPWSHQIGQGPYRLDIERPFAPQTGADANTDLLYLTVSFGGLNHRVMFEHHSGTNGRYGTFWDLSAWPNGSEISTYGNYCETIYQTASSGRPTEVPNTNTISFTLPEPQLVFIEAFRKRGNLRWSNSGSNRRTDWSGITTNSLPNKEYFPSNSDTLKIDYSAAEGTFSPDLVLALSYLGG